MRAIKAEDEDGCKLGQLSAELSRQWTDSSRPPPYFFIGHVGQREKCHGYLTV